MGHANSLPTKSKLIKFKLTKSKRKISESIKSEPKESKPAKVKPPKSPNTLRPSPTPLNGRPLKDEDLPWRVSGRSGAKFFVRKLHRGPSIWHQYGWKKCHDHQKCKDKDPIILFTCKMIPEQSRHLKNIDTACRNVVITFIEHRNEMRCRCSLECVTKGTTRETSNVCEARDRAVHKAIKKHDKICTCGAFDFVQQERNTTPQKTALHLKVGKTCRAPADPNTPSSLRTLLPSRIPESSRTVALPPEQAHSHFKDTLQDFSDDDYKENIFKGMKRKW